MSEEELLADANSDEGVENAPLAVAIALGSASTSESDNFLRNQNELAGDQRRLLALRIEELSHELGLRHWSLRVRYLSGVLKLTFEIGLAVVVIGAAAFIGAAVWNAAHSEGLVIEPFSVPPSLASKGITGEVIASQMLDRLNFLQNNTESSRPGKSYTNSWGNDLKVEIPETGVSLGEAYRFMRRWLGNETHVSGEIISTPTGISITARTGNNSGIAFRGSEADLDSLVTKSAEQIYSVTQPDRYARYLFFPRPGLEKPRFAEAQTVLTNMATAGRPSDRPWGWFGLAVMSRFRGDYSAASAASRNAINGNPTMALPMSGLVASEVELSHPESALAAAREVIPLLEKGPIDQVDTAFVAPTLYRARSLYAFLTGDYENAANIAANAVRTARASSLASRVSFEAMVIRFLSLLHDHRRLEEYRQQLPSPASPLDKTFENVANLLAEGEEGNYGRVIASEVGVEQEANALGESFIVTDTFDVQLRPMLALAMARIGKLSDAQTLIARSPLDCYDCIRIRGLIAEQAGLPTKADEWFLRATHDCPSIPRAYFDWGMVLLRRGEPENAIQKFEIAHQKGPHFADPLEGWGEALMAKNQSHLALSKFAEASKYTPNWGRLHLKWGEALLYAGRKEEAKRGLARAATLDLSSSERAEMARVQ